MIARGYRAAGRMPEGARTSAIRSCGSRAIVLRSSWAGRGSGTRTVTGNQVIYRRGAVRRMLRALGSNDSVAVLIDQHIQPVDAVTVQFFHRSASTTSAVAALALRTGAAVIPAFGLPTADGKYRMVYEHPIEPPGPYSPDPIVEFTQRCTDVLEMYVRRHPHLWLWMHRRWRDPNTGEEALAGMFPQARKEPSGEEDGELSV